MKTEYYHTQMEKDRKIGLVVVAFLVAALMCLGAYRLFFGP